MVSNISTDLGFGYVSLALLVRIEDYRERVS